MNIFQQTVPLFNQLANTTSSDLKQKYSVRHTELDKEFYDEHYIRTERMQQQAIKGTEELDTFPELTQDLFMSLFQYEPTLVADEEIRKKYQLNNMLVKSVLASEDYNELHDNTVYDYAYATLGCEIIQACALKVLKDLRNEQQDQQQPGENPDSGGTPNNSNGNTPDGDENDMADEQLSTLQQIINNMMDEQMSDFKEGVQQAIEYAVAEANSEVQETSNAMSSYGLNPGDPNRRVPLEQRMEALSRLRKSEKLKKYADAIGRFRDMAVEEVKRKQRDGVSIESIGTGNNLPLVLSAEKVKFIHPVAKKDFQRRYLDRQLLQFEVEGTETLARGPIIACIDSSGSMNENNGEPDMWARATAMALYEMAQQQRRNFACIIFSNDVDKVIKMPHHKVNPSDVFDMVEINPGGGTDFEKPLRAALEIMKDNRYHAGDITMITDGEAQLSDSFLKEFLTQKTEQEFKVRSVFIDTKRTSNHADVLNKFSDSIIRVSELLQNDDAILKILQDID